MVFIYIGIRTQKETRAHQKLFELNRSRLRSLGRDETVCLYCGSKNFRIRGKKRLIEIFNNVILNICY